MASNTEPPGLGTALSRLEAQLSPEQRAELHALGIEIAKIAEEADKYQKSLLRRLGVRTDLEDKDEFWIQLWAAARYVGFSNEEFWSLTPRHLCAVLELKAAEFERLAGAATRVVSPEFRGAAVLRQIEVSSAEPQPVSPGKTPGRGPKPDYETKARVAEVVERVAPDGDWRSKLDDICDALDEAEIPSPQTWRKRNRAYRWADYDEKSNAIKAIEYRLGVAKQRKKTSSETLS